MSAEAAASTPNEGVTLANVGVINHILWHKAVQGVDDDNDRLNSYLRLVKDGEHVGMKDEFDRSIALAFELVVQAQLDPWKVDLVRFSRLYLERARERKIDLVIAGRIILMAWTVLKLQSEDLVRKMEVRQQETAELQWDQIDHGWEMPGDAFDYTQRVLGLRRPIDEKIWHEGDRPVTLMELVDAFETARTEAATRIRLAEERDRLREMLRAEGITRFHGRVHKEDLEEDIRTIWERICGQNGGAIPLRVLYDERDVWDFVTAFNSVLFLHRDRRIQLWQDDFPYGPVHLKNLVKGEPDEVVEAPAAIVEEEDGAGEPEDEQGEPEAKTP